MTIASLNAVVRSRSCDRLVLPALLIAGNDVWRFRQPESSLFAVLPAGSSISLRLEAHRPLNLGSRPASWWEASLVQPGGGPPHCHFEQTRLSIMKLGIHDLSVWPDPFTTPGRYCYFDHGGVTRSCARSDRLPKMLVLVPKKVSDGALLLHVLPKSLTGVFRSLSESPRWFSAGSRKTSSMHLASSPIVMGTAARRRAPTRAGQCSRKQAVFRHDQVEYVANERTPSPGFQSYLPAITRASPLNFSESVPASLARAADALRRWLGTHGVTIAAATTASVNATLPI